MKAIELFAGAGGLGMGVSKAGFTPELVVEWDKWCCDTVRENRSRKSSMVANWPIPHEGDVAKVDFRPFEDTIELVTGGPPCQPFSLGGKHRGSSDARDMWPQAVRAIREVRPKAFIFENVKGLARATFASYLAYIFHQLSHPEIVRKSGEKFGDHLARLERHHTSGSRSGLSYRVVYRVLNAADYGIPQRRERIVFVGFRDDLGIEWNFPKETHSFDVLAWEQCGSGAYWERHRVARKNRVISPRVAERAKVITGPYSTSAWRTTRDAISDIPDPEFHSVLASKFNNHRFQAGARSYPGHTGSPLDEPAKTLKAGVHGVPGGENMLMRPDGSVRYFTVRESARLQTFPDDYVFHGSWTETMRQLGNAVPVELARVIARDVRRNLESVFSEN
jgi:DNA (cytosine-5)-methyltransferase 1